MNTKHTFITRDQLYVDNFTKKGTWQKGERFEIIKQKKKFNFRSTETLEGPFFSFRVDRNKIVLKTINEIFQLRLLVNRNHPSQRCNNALKTNSEMTSAEFGGKNDSKNILGKIVILLTWSQFLQRLREFPKKNFRAEFYFFSNSIFNLRFFFGLSFSPGKVAMPRLLKI